MGIYAMTGSATGIGAAVKKKLEDRGDQVTGVDIKDSDIVADLSTQEGREKAVAGIQNAAPDGLDGFIPVAGVGTTVPDLALILSVNYFGARILTENVKELLVKKKGTVVIVSSNSAPLPGISEDLVNVLLEDNDEEKARKLVKSLDGTNAYAGSKLALTRWMRRVAPSWAAEGVRVNAVAPGATMTPLLQEGLDHPEYGEAIRNFPVPLGGFGTPEQIADGILFMLSEGSSFCCGSVLFVDGGTDALLRPDQF
jgi:NAD(P)-dependent dehydrogenase (short-subunit alcohol dehydrogenase family)